MWLIYVVDQVNWLDAGFDVGNQKVHELRLSGVKTERHSASALASQGPDVEVEQCNVNARHLHIIVFTQQYHDDFSNI
jgi:hypothetical protein